MKIIGKYIIAITFLTVIMAPSYSQTPGKTREPELPDWQKVNSKIALPIITNINLGKFKLELEKATLPGMAKLSGNNHIERRGDAGGSEYWICFSDAHQKIWMASGELGGSRHSINSIQISKKYPKEQLSSCPDLPSHMKPVSINGKTFLGLHKSRVLGYFGKPSTQIDGWWIYSYTGDSPLPGFDQSSNFTVYLVDDKVTSIFISQVTTN